MPVICLKSYPLKYEREYLISIGISDIWIEKNRIQHKWGFIIFFALISGYSSQNEKLFFII